MIPNLPVSKIQLAFQAALKNGLIRNEDSAVIFYDLSYLEERILHLAKQFPPSTLHGIAVKANPLKRILDLLKKLDMGAEAASLGEVSIVLDTGYSPKKIVFDSPVKTIEDLEFALKTGIHINIDSLSELERVAAIKKKNTSDSTIGIRINPQVGTGTILESSVAGEYSKFGVPIKSGRADLIEAFTKYKWLTGVHLHVGSQGCPMDLLLN
jgi:diaminopimelate decarboxylase